jgi:hypothetical protein
MALCEVISFVTGMNGRQIFYSQPTYMIALFDGRKMKWRNVKTVEPKLPAPEKAGRWLDAQTSQGKEPN